MEPTDSGHHPEVARELRKNRLLDEVQQALQSGDITAHELRAILPADYGNAAPIPAAGGPVTTVTPVVSPPYQQMGASESPAPALKKKLSAVEIMFYIAGIILFASLMTFIAESWGDGPGFQQIGLSAGMGALLWVAAYVLNNQPTSSEIRKGLVNAQILTGSLSTIVGGFIILDIIVGQDQTHFLIPGAITISLLASIHFLYDRLMRKDIILLLAIFMAVAAFPLLVSGLLEPLNPAPDVYALVSIGAAMLLVYAASTVYRIMPDRTVLNHPFDGLATFVALLTMFAASFGDYGMIWLILLIGSVFGLFYLSIIRRSKDLLGNASLFLIISVLTIAFKYFSGFSAGVSLIIAAAGVLGTAAMATTINKKYFKAPQAN